MKFTIDRDTLRSTLSCVLKGMDMNSTLPILSGILITGAEGILQFESTNMEVSILQRRIANVEEPGRVVVPCHLLSDIVGHLPDMAISCETTGTQLAVSCGTSHYVLNTMHAQDFPSFPSYTLDSTVELSCESLADMVKRVAVAASTDRNRSILNGVLVSITHEEVSFVTTDSVRLAVARTKAMSEVDSFEIIAPARSLASVLTLAQNERTITIGANQSQLVFLFGDVTYVSRRIEGRYPNYQKLIPTTHSARVRMRVNELYEAMQRIKAMTQSNSEVVFQIDAAAGLLTIVSNLPEQGNAREELSVEIEGEDLSIAFNSRFIYDCLQRGDEDAMIVFEAESPFRPGIFRIDSPKMDFLYLVMPVRPNF